MLKIRRSEVPALVIFIITINSIGCAEKSEAGAPDTSAIRQDAGLVPSADSGPLVEVMITSISPEHLSTDVPPTKPITFRVVHLIGENASLSRLQSATTVVEWPTKKAVPGKWSVFGTGNYKAIFTPSAALSEGDYLVDIVPNGNMLKATVEKSLFHVGSLPRIQGIRFAKTTKGTANGWDIIEPLYSEEIDPAKVKATVEAQQTSSWTALSLTKTGTNIVLSAPLEIDKEIRITIDSDVGAASGTKLDGLYTGKPNSGNFTATFKPKDYAESGKTWVPNLQL